MAKASTPPSNVVAEIPADLPPEQTLAPLPPEIVERLAATAPEAADPPKRTAFVERPITRSVAAAAANTSAATTGAVPSFLGGLSDEQLAARDALQQFTGLVLGMVQQTSQTLSQAERMLGAAQAMPAVVATAQRDGIDLAKTGELLADLRAALSKHGI